MVKTHQVQKVLNHLIIKTIKSALLVTPFKIVMISLRKRNKNMPMGRLELTAPWLLTECSTIELNSSKVSTGS